MTTTTQDKLGAYSTHQHTVDNSRDIDARALLTCAGRLQEILDAGGADAAALGEAVRRNQRLWTIFQVALCDPDNPLPKDLKITLLNLSRYVDRVSFRAVAEYAPQLLKSLIDINRTIAVGLAKKPPQTEQAQPTVASPPPPAVRQAVSVVTSA